MLQIGQLVICTADERLLAEIRRVVPVGFVPHHGGVYTVSGIKTNCPTCGGDHLFLDEVQTPLPDGFPAFWFRPCRPANFELFVQRLFPAMPDRRVTG